jgi:mono/diheme cytochrome c family protein
MMNILMSMLDNPMKKINKFTVWAVLVASIVGLSSCGSDPADTGIEYAPEMYHSIPLEPYTQIAGHWSPFRDSLNAQAPPEGTIARDGHPSYTLTNDSAGWKVADSQLSNPILPTAKNMAMGDTLYKRYCGLCHGSKMNGDAGDGPLAKHDAINPPDFNVAPYNNYSNGRFYFTIMHGKGVMGSYASQLPYEDRWKVIHYIQSKLHPEQYKGLGENGLPKSGAAPADSSHASATPH